MLAIKSHLRIYYILLNDSINNLVSRGIQSYIRYLDGPLELFKAAKALKRKWWSSFIRCVSDCWLSFFYQSWMQEPYYVWHYVLYNNSSRLQDMDLDFRCNKVPKSASVYFTSMCCICSTLNPLGEKTIYKIIKKSFLPPSKMYCCASLQTQHYVNNLCSLIFYTRK